MEQVKKIIVNFPTNIGDALLTLPALGRIKNNFPQAEITAIVSPKTKNFLNKNSFIDRTVFFNKKWPVSQKIGFCRKLRGKFDLMADFKNSLLPFFLKVKVRTPYLRCFKPGEHNTKRYLFLVRKIAPKETKAKSTFIQSQKKNWNLATDKKIVFLAPFSSSSRKEYPGDNLEKMLENLWYKYNFVLLGLEGDRRKIKPLLLEKGVIDLTGKTEISDIYHLLRRYADCLLAVDSSIMHLASYLDVPVVALFGPTDPARYGPYGKKSLVLQRNDLDCVPCRQKKCLRQNACMNIAPARAAQTIINTINHR